ncbi:hypothetical protein, partial [Shewanella sp. S1-49-MNA-CIBAN-0167]|uniref:hypothetical protein n=1 Tax=Shewanella sp. S1-49-MNA-CIBAN-0167 TaxID=3140468 RepID=UPI0033234DF1
ANSGPKAVDMLRKQRGELLLVDWMIPEMNGSEVITAIDKMVEDGSLAKTPINKLMTAYAADPIDK